MRPSDARLLRGRQISHSASEFENHGGHGMRFNRSPAGAVGYAMIEPHATGAAYFSGGGGTAETRSIGDGFCNFLKTLRRVGAPATAGVPGRLPV